ncbi:Target of rapamycin complex 1 subunit mip1 [Mycena sanguinolenta]|uniref:Target of rapamycin complex 1 subunit mip1 n=1 Tax=Mycena sanguinolenta TaxID=230812 RepID=A0A8H6XC65_9AGAR|nr:Target of rapamycin complex 1 subunit mip1 [Mycena sanguinolenta]
MSGQPRPQRKKFVAGGGSRRDWSRDDSTESTEHASEYLSSHSDERSLGSRPGPNDLLMNGTHFSDDIALETDASSSPSCAILVCETPSQLEIPLRSHPGLQKPIPWRGSSPGRLRTANAALVLCLNIDVDPPDVVKTNPCAVLEAWVDPHTIPSQKAMEAIAANLKLQFEGLSLKIMYKAVQDPSYDDLWRSCVSLRKQAKDDAVLFHYNGHGVPKPTASGELWCFNRTYTQYIPVSLQEVQTWLGSPATSTSSPNDAISNRDYCTAVRWTEHSHSCSPSNWQHVLQTSSSPSCPELPADLFTSCLTSPIDIALRYFIMHHQLPNNITADMIMQLPGDLKDRKTPLGETIHLHPAYLPPLPRRTPIHYGRLGTWLLTPACGSFPELLFKAPDGKAPDKQPGEKGYNYIPSRFFADQLTAFEVWISRGGAALTKRGPMSLPPSGDRTPISCLANPQISSPSSFRFSCVQPHRLRALILLSQFVDLGPWAPPAQISRPVLIFIWARIMAVDPSVQADLVNTNGYKYFAAILGARDEQALPNSSEHKAMYACVHARVFDYCYDKLDEPDFLLRQWSALCIAQMWDGHDENKVHGVDRGTQDKLIQLLSDDSVEVRCAALYALGTFMGASGSSNPRKRGGGGSGTMPHFESKDDASPMCRKELIVLLSCLVKEYRGFFRRSGHYPDDDDSIHTTSQAVADWLDRFDEAEQPEQRVYLSSFFTMFVALLDLSVDPYHEVATNAQTVLDYIMALLLESPFARLEGILSTRSHASTISASPSFAPPPSPGIRPGLSRTDTMTSTISNGVSNTIRRTSSFANALKSLANGIAFPSAEEPHAPTPAEVLARPDAHTSRPPSPNLNLAKYASPYSDSFAPNYSRSAPPSPRPSFDAPSHASADFMAWNVIEALIEEDMERLRARRRSGSAPRRGHHHGGSAPSPSSSLSSMDSNNSVILGLGTGVGMADVLPLKSTFFDWCSEYFIEPQMRQAEADEPGSIQFNYQLWRQQRNETVIDETQRQSLLAESRPWDRPVATLQVSGHPQTMVFHSYDKHLFIANESDVVSVWDWSQRRRLTSFHNGNPAGTSVSSLRVINQDVGGMILTGSTDGIVRLYRNYDPAVDQGPVQMVSAFRGLTELVVNIRQGAGLVMDWMQNTGLLLVGGDSRTIKVWDAQTETPTLDLDTNSDSPVTAIVCDMEPSQVFAASFANGEVKLFDRRMEEEDSVVRKFVEHESWVQNVRWHPTTRSQFLSASLDGKVKLWDWRGADNSAMTWDLLSDGLSSFDCHPITGVFAVTSTISSRAWKSQRVMVHSLKENRTVSSFGVSTGLMAPLPRGLSSSFPRSNSLAFHPLEMLYGVGEPDGTVRVLGCKLN